MAVAKVQLIDLIKFKEETEQFTAIMKEMQSKIDTLEIEDRNIKKEIDEYEGASKKCEQLISELKEKIRKLEEKKRRLENKIRIIKAEIKAVNLEIATIKAEITALYAELAAAPPGAKAAIVSSIHQAKENLGALKSRKADLEEKLNQTQAELDKTINNIQIAKDLLGRTTQKQSQIREGIQNLNNASNQLRQVICSLRDLLQKMINDSRHATERLTKSQEYINRYIDISIGNVSYSLQKDVQLRRCINLGFAGKTFDYCAARNDNGELFTPEQVRYFQEKYPNVQYSKVDSYGNTYPNISKFSVFSYTFPPVTKENLAAGSCLVGDSKAGSSDFKKFRQAMEMAGYSREEIARLLSTHTIHHDEDGQTLHLIPREVHKACRHNGGAEKIRLQISML